MSRTRRYLGAFNFFKEAIISHFKYTKQNFGLRVTSWLLKTTVKKVGVTIWKNLRKQKNM